MEDAGVDDAGFEPGVFKFLIADFGAVLRGETVERTATFSTTGATPLLLTGFSTSAPFTLVGADTLTVPAHGEASLTIRYTPTTLGPVGGTLTFQATRPQTLALHGIGVGPALDLAPDRLDLGTLPLYDGFPATATSGLSLRNAGLDAVPSRPETALQVFFDVQPTSGASPGELCAGDCTSAPLSLAIDAGIVVPLTLSSTTVGLKSWDVRVFSNDPGAPMKTVPVVAEVVARPLCQFAVPAQLAFGVVTSPQSRDLEVVFENVGSENCEVSHVDIGPETPLQRDRLYSVVNAPTTTQIIAPGGLLRVIIRAWPQGAPPLAPQLVNADLRFTINHPALFARVPLSAQLALSCLTVTPTPVNFATVETGCRSADRPVTLRNVCTHNLVVTSATLPGFSSFSVAAALPVTLAPNGSTQLTTRYTPFASGAERDVIDVAWLDGAVAQHTTVPLLGEANPSGLNTDRFPPVPNKLDLLLVIDDSCSMADKVARLNAELLALLPALQRHNVDFHLGVVAAAYPEPGFPPLLRRTSVGAVRWLEPGTSSLSTRFTELTAYTGQAYDESCEEAVLAALTPPYVSDLSLNGGFLRPDAALDVVCIGDFVNTAQHLEELQQIKGPGGRFRWDEIGPTGPQTAQCSVTGTLGPFVNTLPGQTGGELVDVCASGWAPLFDSIAAQTSEVRTFFPLAARPDPLGATSLSVEVGGQAVTSTTDAGVAIWSWESAPNAVRFTPIYAPQANDTVTVTYPVACAP